MMKRIGISMDTEKGVINYDIDDEAGTEEVAIAIAFLEAIIAKTHKFDTEATRMFIDEVKRFKLDGAVINLEEE